MQKDLLTKLRRLVLLKAKFALSGSVATLVDYVLYLILVKTLFSPELSNVISYSIAVVINFLMQKRFVFQLQRSAGKAFVGSLLVSLGGLLLSTGIISILSGFPFFSTYQSVTKLLATGIVFFYNFYFKRFVFERRFFATDES